MSDSPRRNGGLSVNSIKRALKEEDEILIVRIENAISQLYNRDRYSKVYAGFVFPECWSLEHGNVDYAPLFDLRDAVLRDRPKVREFCRKTEYPKYVKEKEYEQHFGFA